MLTKISRGAKSICLSCRCSNTASWREKDLGESGRARLVDLKCISHFKPNKDCISAVIYLLIGASVVSTLALWQFMVFNSSTGSQANYRAVRSLDTGGLRDLFDLSNVNEDLKNLFVVEPAQDQSKFKAQMLEQDKIVEQYEREEIERKKDIEVPQETGHHSYHGYGPFSCTSKPICPEIDIPGLVGKRKLDLKDITMKNAEDLIFGPLAERVREGVKRANDTLRKKLVDPKTGNISHVDWLFDQVIESEALNVSKYWYLPGGHWKPANCLPRWKVAVLIPFRDRFHHLPIILRYLVPMLQRQLLEFSFFIIEQANQDLFNRAMLMNIGYLESLNFTDYDCFVIHDVDHVPLDDRNYYGCSGMPRHFVSGADRWNYKLPYDNFFGAVTGLTKGNIRSINGFPNVYWGWGGEDDEIWKRVKDVGLEITRHKGPIAHYDVIRHHHKSAPLAKDRYSLLKNFNNRYKMDGLSDIIYPTPIYDLHTLYTNISVDIRRIKPHYPMPAPKAGNQGDLAKKISGLAMKAKVASRKAGPGVRRVVVKAPAEAKKESQPNADTGKEQNGGANDKPEKDKTEGNEKDDGEKIENNGRRREDEGGERG
ncbi:uncharacterized protein LOC129272458 [Lytechinus pictus]|uniref:uncharacterized protein LOC129272458 n=1 Tax=Lytechinus pictus TaxID=7653 RepID=UPI0030BA273A